MAQASSKNSKMDIPIPVVAIVQCQLILPLTIQSFVEVETEIAMDFVSSSSKG